MFLFNIVGLSDPVSLRNFGKNGILKLNSIKKIAISIQAVTIITKL
jgi:hypothetical protein